MSVQGAILILLLLAIATTAWRGFETIQEGFNRWTRMALGLSALTLLVAAMVVRPEAHVLRIGLGGRFVGVALGLLAVAVLARRLAPEDLSSWLWESWRFVKQILPLLVVGVFIVGVIRGIIRPEWIEALAGRNSLTGNAAGVAFGVFMYFPTLVEVPIARMFLDLGMHRGPLLAYLMADPELSLQSIFIITAIIGRARAWTYVALVALMSATAGWLYGAWIDGTGGWVIATYVLGSAALLLAAARLVASRLAPPIHS